MKNKRFIYLIVKKNFSKSMKPKALIFVRTESLRKKIVLFYFFLFLIYDTKKIYEIMKKNIYKK